MLLPVAVFEGPVPIFPRDSSSLQKRREKGREAKLRKQRQAHQRMRQVFPQKKEAAPLSPIPVEPEALDVPVCSLPSRAKIEKHGWTKSSLNEAREVPK